MVMYQLMQNYYKTSIKWWYTGAIF